MKNKILPISTPIIRGFSHQAVLTSIMLSYERCKPWICNNYIQTFSLLDLKNSLSRIGTIDFFYTEYTDFNRGEYKINPWIRYNEIPIFLIDQVESSLLDKIIKFLDVGFYLNIDIDMQYIPAYQEEHYQEHMLLIYGYDEELKVFYCMDNFLNGKLSIQQIEFSDLINSVNSRLNFFMTNHEFTTDNPGPLLATIGVVDKISDRNYSSLQQVDLKRILYLLNSYLNPDLFYAEQSDNSYYVYGINIYKEMIDYYQQSLNNKTDVEIRGLYSFMDHKALMIWRLTYIQEKLNIDCEEYIIEYKKITTKFG